VRVNIFPSTVYLVRHAAPDRTTGIRYDIPPGPPLLSQGEAEAAQLGEFLRSAHVQKMYVSPMERTQQTARIAAEAGGNIPWTLEESIIEWARGENEDAILERMLAFWEQAWVESKRTGPIALVGHGGPTRVLVEHLGVPKEKLAHYRKQFDYDNPMPPAGVWRTIQDASPEEWLVELVFAPQPFDPFPEDERAAQAPSGSYPAV
jgi:broad specificity phosphatase PhoE